MKQFLDGVAWVVVYLVGAGLVTAGVVAVFVAPMIIKIGVILGALIIWAMHRIGDV